MGASRSTQGGAEWDHRLPEWAAVSARRTRRTLPVLPADPAGIDYAAPLTWRSAAAEIGKRHYQDSRL